MPYRITDQFIFTGERVQVGQHHTASIHVPILDATESDELLLNVKGRLAAGDKITLVYHGAALGEDPRKQRLIEVGEIRVVEVGDKSVEFRRVGEIERYEPRAKPKAETVAPEKRELRIEKRLAGGYAVKDSDSDHDHEWFATLPEAVDYVAREGDQGAPETVIEQEPPEAKPEVSEGPEAAPMTVKRGKGEFLVLDANGAALESFKTKKLAEEYAAAYGAPQEAEAA
jgi:hypothetical protein